MVRKSILPPRPSLRRLSAEDIENPREGVSVKGLPEPGDEPEPLNFQKEEPEEAPPFRLRSSRSGKGEPLNQLRNISRQAPGYLGNSGRGLPIFASIRPDTRLSAITERSEFSRQTTPSYHMSKSSRPNGRFETGKAERTFEFGEMLGAGGFGAVRKVTKHLDGATYALKGCPIPDDPAEINLTLREVQTMAKLGNCNNVVRYYDAWIERITPEMANRFVNPDSCPKDAEGKAVVEPLMLFIQLELCDLSLREWLQKEPNRTAADTWDIFVQIVEGLCYIHEHGLIHRDIKPGNVLLKHHKDGLHAKLGDLGLAKFNDKPGALIASKRGERDKILT